MVKDNTKKQTFRKGLSRTLNLQYIKLLALFLVFTILWVLLFGKFIYPTLTYESGGYIAISSTTAFLIMIAIPIITWFCFSFWFFKKPLKYLDDLAQASTQLALDKTVPITLGRDLSEVESELNRVREEALKNEQALQEAELKKNDLLMYLAHDLKTPLTSIIGYLSLLVEAGDSLPTELRAKYAGIALDKAEHLDSLVNEFFDVTRLTLTTMTLNRHECNLSLLLHQLMSESLPLLAADGMTWESNIEENVQINCDGEKLQRVLDNLTRNACSYSYPNTPIRLSLRTDAENAVIQMTNSGPTIPKNKLNHLFDQFYRLDSARNTSTGGVGLGLAIAKEIIELHDGSITVGSKDESICFTVTLPRLQDTHISK